MFCPHCGKEVADNQAYCHYCGSVLVEPVVSVSDGRSKTPWEDRSMSGFFTGLAKTLKETLIAPSQFFKKMAVTGGLTDPMLYAMIVGMVGLTFLYIWDVLLNAPLRSFMTTELRVAENQPLVGTLGTVATAVLTPFILVFWLFLVSGMLHIFLLMVRGARAGFEATFRVISYALSPFVLLAIPVCGMPITSLWIIILVIIGFKEAHGISTGKASLSVLFPFILCCGLIMLGIAIFMSAVAASFGWIVNMSP